MNESTTHVLCALCGIRKGLHKALSLHCPNRDPRVLASFKLYDKFTWGVSVPLPEPVVTSKPSCPTCGQKVPRVIRVGDVVSTKRGYIGIVVKPSSYKPADQSWVHFLGKDKAIPQMHKTLTLVHGHFHITERIEP